MKRGRLMIVAIAGAMLLWPAMGRSWSGASGVQTTFTLFESHRHPDVPLDSFAAGRLGLIKPTWADSYLYVSYRYLVGQGFGPTEQKVLVSTWNRWLGLEPLTIPPATIYSPSQSRAINEEELKWFAARNLVPGVEAIDSLDVYRSAQTSLGGGKFVSGFYYPNCNASAFLTAASTLQTMIGRFGVSSPEVKRWVYAQDHVFDNCSNTPPHFATIPPNPKAWFADVGRWLSARAMVPGLPQSPPVTNSCEGEYFRTAAIVLETMIGNLGLSSPQVRQWIEAQDQAFQVCSRRPRVFAAATPTPIPSPGIPQSLTNGTPFEQAQRTYQIACANFYAGNFDKARQMFDAIAADRASPWHEWAPYLAARATIRKATLSGPTNDRAILAKAEIQLKAIIAASGDERVKRAAEQLLSFVEFQLHPEQRIEQVTQALMRPSDPTLAQDLSDYVGSSGHSAKDSDGFYVDDLTDWIASFSQISAFVRVNQSGYLAHSLVKWKKIGSMPWLIAAMAQVDGSDPNAPALIAAAEKVKPESPAYVTVAFHAARLLMEQGKIDEARSRLDRLLAMRKALPVSTVNEVARLRMMMARNLNELLTYAQRTPLGVTDTGDGDELPSNLDVPWLSDAAQLKQFLAGPLFDRDGAAVLSRWTPLSVQVRTAQSRILPDDLRARMALAAWTRAILLGDNAPARELAPEVGQLMPELKPSMDAWLAQKNPKARRFEAAFIMLTHPGIRPYVDPGVGRVTPLDKMDGLRDNWWRFPPWYESWQTGMGRRPPKVTYPPFLSAAQRKSADEQWSRLKAINAPNLLCSEAIGEARRKPGNELVPHALYQCIRAVHLGCSNERGTEYAKLAYYLLHRRYPDSTWASLNRFWYRGGGCPN